uniref:Uncharacterized protein n=1 Tax=Ciona savignyi TaxID=51511 RepID=H2YHR8_CIOSA
TTHVLNLTQKSRELSKELEERERKIVEESTSREQELVQQNKNLNEKLECLNAKLATAFSEKLSLEKDLEKLGGRYAHDERTRRENEEKLKKENKEILANVESLQLELAHVISKAKDLSVEFDHKEHCYNTAISDVCHKLSLLHRNMRPLSNEVRPFTFLPSQNSC